MKHLRKRKLAKQFGVRIHVDQQLGKTVFQSHTNRFVTFLMNDATFVNIVKNEDRWNKPWATMYVHPPENPVRKQLKAYIDKSIAYALENNLPVQIVPGISPVDLYDYDSILTMLNGIQWDEWRDPSFDPSVLYV